MKQRLLLIICAFILSVNLSYSQIIDRYGINIGTSYSTQIWKPKWHNYDIKYKYGLQAFLQAEKDFTKVLALRLEFGYLQKGFIDNSPPVIILNNGYGPRIEPINNKVILHDLALNIGLKIKPFKTICAPYLFIGLRSDYMIAYKDLEYAPPYSTIMTPYEYTLKTFNKFNCGGLISYGIDIDNLFYFEIEFNPNFTKNLNDTYLSVRDNCWGLKIGLNMNKLFETKHKRTILDILNETLPQKKL